MKRSLLAVLFAWLLPGAGHWYVGQRAKGVLFCFFLIALFALGVLLTNGAGVDVHHHPYALVLQACTGTPALVALVLTDDARQLSPSKINDFGLLCTLIAGALNVLLIADLLYRTGPPTKDEAHD